MTMMEMEGANAKHGGEVKENGTGRVDLLGMGCRSPMWLLSKLPQTPTHFASTLREKVHPDRPADRCMTMLDGLCGPNICRRFQCRRWRCPNRAKMI